MDGEPAETNMENLERRNYFLKHSSSQDCWKVSYVGPVFKNLGSFWSTLFLLSFLFVFYYISMPYGDCSDCSDCLCFNYIKAKHGSIVFTKG